VRCDNCDRAKTVLSARAAPQSGKCWGEYFLVDANKRHVILRDHIDLYELINEIGAIATGR
jgi:hypothetical protein